MNISEPSVRFASLQEVGAFFTHVWKTVYRGGSFPALLDTDRLPHADEFVVAELRGEIIGAVTLAGLKGQRPPTLDTVYVVPTKRGRGIAARLCEAALRRFMEAGKTPVSCDVTTNKMQRALDKLPPDIQAIVKPIASYQEYGDEWEDSGWDEREQQGPWWRTLLRGVDRNE
jgi:GNAT superfamily N-acetyltransferase